MKKILITGKNSYVGINFLNFLRESPNKYSTEAISLRNNNLRNLDFSNFDVVVHVAGIAHIKETKYNKNLYYEVNRDLAYETAKKAKKDGIKQFIFLSTMSVYGIKDGVINANSALNPVSDYGKSKLQAEELISSLSDSSFKVAIVRPPMIYGKNCRGNYPRLAKLALQTPVFPKINNKRSMIYIDNLSYFLQAIIENYDSGIFFPQNREFVNTTSMVKLIAESHGKQIRFTKFFNPLILLVIKNNNISKVFGDLVYDKTLSNYNKFNYKKMIDFKQTIQLTED